MQGFIFSKLKRNLTSGTVHNHLNRSVNKIRRHPPIKFLPLGHPSRTYTSSSDENKKHYIIEPTAHVDDTAIIGKNTYIGHFVQVGPNVNIGDGCFVHSHCTVTNCDIGERVVLNSGTRIGQVSNIDILSLNNSSHTCIKLHICKHVLNFCDILVFKIKDSFE